jgi:hypothetical protein
MIFYPEILEQLGIRIGYFTLKSPDLSFKKCLALAPVLLSPTNGGEARPSHALSHAAVGGHDS